MEVKGVEMVPRREGFVRDILVAEEPEGSELELTTSSVPSVWIKEFGDNPSEMLNTKGPSEVPSVIWKVSEID